MRERKREIKLVKRKSEGKEQKKYFKEEIVDALFKSNIINTVVEKHLIRNFTC